VDKARVTALLTTLIRGAGQAGDTGALRLGAALRCGVVTVAAGAGSFAEDLSGRATAAFLVVGLLWLPWSIVVLFSSERHGSRLAAAGGPYGDLVALFLVQALVPHTAPAILFGYLAVVAFAAYTAGRSVAGPVALLSVVAAAAASGLAPSSQEIDGGMLAALAGGLVAVLALVERAVAVQLRASAESVRLEGKAGAILARVADGVIVTDAKGRIVQCNPAAERMVGTEAGDMIGRSCEEILGLRVGERRLDCSTSCALLALADPDEAALGHETWRWNHEHRRQPLLANAEAVVDEDARKVEVVHSLRDVTRLKQAEEAKTLFLATASHELKTPLTVIRGFAETLLSYPDVPEEHRTAGLKAVRQRAEELSTIVDRLLLSSRIEAGRAQVRIARVTPGPILEERAETLFKATGRTVECEIDGDLPDVSADPQGLVTVVDHLLDNALKYSPNGAPVWVRASRHGDGARIDIQDGGIGMDAEQAAHCFDKFWQAESTDVRRFGGTGIGLYIVRSLVEGMGGTVEVHSTAGMGTTFTVILGPAPGRSGDDPGSGEQNSIREFMRQLGVPERAGA
jgi:PAS domain S-box-containing protein